MRWPRSGHRRRVARVRYDEAVHALQHADVPRVGCRGERGTKLPLHRKGSSRFWLACSRAPVPRPRTRAHARPEQPVRFVAHVARSVEPLPRPAASESVLIRHSYRAGIAVSPAELPTRRFRANVCEHFCRIDIGLFEGMPFTKVQVTLSKRLSISQKLVITHLTHQHGDRPAMTGQTNLLPRFCFADQTREIVFGICDRKTAQRTLLSASPGNGLKWP